MASDQDAEATTMMFRPDERREFLIKWEHDKQDCRRAVGNEKVLNRPRWTPDYHPGPFPTEKDRQAYMNLFRCHPFYDEVHFHADGTFKPPPIFTALSDELVFMVAKTVSQHDRGRKWPADFTRGGDIRIERTPKDPGPRIDAHGLPTAPIFKGYYVLLGHSAAKAAGGWKLASKTNKQLRRGSNRSDWTVGSVVLAVEFATIPRSITYQAHDSSGSIIDLRALIFYNNLFYSGHSGYSASIAKADQGEMNTKCDLESDPDAIRVVRELRIGSDSVAPSPTLVPDRSSVRNLETGRSSGSGSGRTWNTSFERDLGDFEFPDHKERMNAPI